jgi:hypothetical protein
MSRSSLYKRAPLSCYLPGESQSYALDHSHTSNQASLHPLGYPSTSTTIMAPNAFIEAMKTRRSIYAVNKDVPISDKAITDIAEQVILHSPSCFNAQASRIVLLLDQEHETFWDFVLEALKPILLPDQFTGFEQKIGGFKAGYGTVSTPVAARPHSALETLILHFLTALIRPSSSRTLHLSSLSARTSPLLPST